MANKEKNLEKSSGKVSGKGSGNNKLIIVILFITLAIVVMMAGAFAYMFFFNKTNPLKSAATTAPTVATAPVQSSTANNNTNTSNGTEVSKYLFSVDDITANLSQTGVYVQLNPYIGYQSAELKKELTSKKPVIRDAINSILCTKKPTDFTPEGQEQLKKDILAKINPILKKGQANNIYFNNIVVH